MQTLPDRTSALRTLFSLVVLFGAALTLVSCGEGIDGAIVDDGDNENKLRQLLLTVELRDDADQAIVVERIDSLRLNLSGKQWGIFSSQTIAAADIPTTATGRHLTTDESVEYLVIADYTVALDTLETAGDFSHYLNQRLRIRPGDYVAEVAEVWFRDKDGVTVVARPNLYFPFTVTANTASQFIGHAVVRVRS
jgi:hypothetical protein